MKSKTLVDSAGEKYSIKLRTLREHNDTLDIVLETGGFIELSKSKVEQLISVLKEAHLNMGTNLQDKKTRQRKYYVSAGGVFSSLDKAIDYLKYVCPKEYVFEEILVFHIDDYKAIESVVFDSCTKKPSIINLCE